MIKIGGTSQPQFTAEQFEPVFKKFWIKAVTIHKTDNEHWHVELIGAEGTDVFDKQLSAESLEQAITIGNKIMDDGFYVYDAVPVTKVRLERLPTSRSFGTKL